MDDPQAAAEPAPTDHRGSRRLSGREQWFWYLLAAVSYIVIGMYEKGLLNWIVGPAWLVLFVSVGPAIVDRVRRRGS